VHVELDILQAVVASSRRWTQASSRGWWLVKFRGGWPFSRRRGRSWVDVVDMKVSSTEPWWKTNRNLCFAITAGADTSYGDTWPLFLGLEGGGCEDVPDHTPQHRTPEQTGKQIPHGRITTTLLKLYLPIQNPKDQKETPATLSR
jgi:hypothetical protein